MSDSRPNFRLAEIDDQRCGSCKHSSTDNNEFTYCMLDAGGSAAAEDGQRVNQNFVCDTFAS